MNKSQIFKKAHQIAKSIVSEVGSYILAMSVALKEVYASLKNKSIAEKLVDLGMSVWGEDFGRPRIYVNLENTKDVFGLEVHQYGTGRISSAFLHGEKISNNRAYKLLDNKIFFCLQNNEFVGTDMEPII